MSVSVAEVASRRETVEGAAPPSEAAGAPAAASEPPTSMMRAPSTCSRTMEWEDEEVRARWSGRTRR
jgi:hypothetical protein